MDFKFINSELNIKGYAEIQNFINKNQLSLIKKFIEDKKKKLNKDNFSLANNELAHPVFDQIIKSKEMNMLISNILKKYVNNADYETHVVLGVRSNSSEKPNIKNLIKFHFDAYFLTINIPISIPKKNSSNLNNSSGDLLIIPNIRNFNTNLIKNIFFKLFFQNFITQFIMSMKVFHKLFNVKRLSLKNNKIYLFFGYRTLHGVDNNYENDERTTLLLHIHNPHSGSKFDNYIKSKHKKQRENLRSRNN